MGFISIVGGLILGVIFFSIVNDMFNITYFGFKGISSTFMSCWSAGAIIIFLLGFVAKWILIIGVVIWILTKIFNGKKA
ncbi:hypothetical protein [Clostridium uliginosum]|uniref:Uncharacterized protein n=1 Tax=Clostridium uliginosum TaxID=119641 RepID=A0A1I1NYI3_9CLOT|nr:hypothetical protein [Clostridium uliginosum]SFC99783.1 hypothetical protein SAMN05421842_11640 [Clostridium uliginosum]